jgi:Ca2+-binding EF-hand superfamily protein
MYQHWRTCFEILDEDGGKTISMTEFSTLGFLFNFSPRAIKNIYTEFDITGNAVGASSASVREEHNRWSNKH